LYELLFCLWLLGLLAIPSTTLPPPSLSAAGRVGRGVEQVGRQERQLAVEAVCELAGAAARQARPGTLA